MGRNTGTSTRAVDREQVFAAFGQRADAAVHDDLQRRAVALQLVHDAVAQRRDLAVLLRRQTVQPGVAGVHDERVAAGGRRRLDEGVEAVRRFVAIDSDAGLHRDRQGARRAHRGDTVGDAGRFGHETCTEASALHPIAGAAHVEVDLVVAGIRREPGAARELGRFGAAELERDGVFRRVEAEEARGVAEQQHAGLDHLGI